MQYYWRFQTIFRPRRFGYRTISHEVIIHSDVCWSLSGAKIHVSRYLRIIFPVMSGFGTNERSLKSFVFEWVQISKFWAQIRANETNKYWDNLKSALNYIPPFPIANLRDHPGNKKSNMQERREISIEILQLQQNFCSVL